MVNTRIGIIQIEKTNRKTIIETQIGQTENNMWSDVLYYTHAQIYMQ